jgi:hypothetical protein
MMHKLQQATGRQRYQLTTDGFRPYVEAVENVLPSYVAFAQLVKIFASPPEGEHVTRRVKSWSRYQYRSRRILI